MKGREDSKHILLSASSMVGSTARQLFVCSLRDKACPSAVSQGMARPRCESPVGNYLLVQRNWEFLMDFMCM